MTDTNGKNPEQPKQNEQEAKIEALPEQPISESDAQSVKGGAQHIPKIVL